MSKGKKGKRSSLPANPSLPPTHQNQVTATRIQSTFSGPLPPPSVLDHYNQIHPGSAEIIITLWQDQVRHRQELEKKAITADILQSWAGSIMGFIVAMTALASGTYAIHLGRPAEGIAAILTALAGLGGAYFYGSWQRRKEREIKHKDSK